VPLQAFFRGNLLRYFTHPLLSSVAPEVPGMEVRPNIWVQVTAY
jgi:hypothetical protein